MKRYQGIIFGKVQGVGFRFLAKRIALELQITGWIRNRSDGSVELEAQGESQHLQLFVDRLKKAPFPAKVNKVSLKQLEVDSSCQQFKIISSF